MAFNFNAINNELQDKANIFAPTQTGQTPAESPEGQAAPSAGQNSGGTSVSLSSGSSQAAGAPPKNPKGSGSGGSSNPAAAQAAYDSIGPGNYQAQTDAIGSKISTANDKLQQEANAYTAKANTTAEGYKVDDDTLLRAGDGDDKSFQTVQSRLSKPLPDQFEAFKGLGDDEIPTAASAIAKPSNFGDIYRDTAGANYSTGANRLNSMQLRRSGDFRNIAMQLGQQNEDLLSNNAKQQDELTNSTRANLAQIYGTETQSARDRLKTQADGVIDVARLEEAADEKRRAGLDVNQYAKTQLEAMRPEQIANLQARDKGYASFYANQDYDLSPYAKINADVDYREFLDDRGASKFNRINSLLGSNSPILAPKERTQDFSFNQQGAKDFLKSSIDGQVGAFDTRIQTDLDELNGQNEAIRAAAQEEEERLAAEAARRRASADAANASRGAATTGEMAKRKPNSPNTR